jgi:hypothetical protein
MSTSVAGVAVPEHEEGAAAVVHGVNAAAPVLQGGVLPQARDLAVDEVPHLGNPVQELVSPDLGFLDGEGGAGDEITGCDFLHGPDCGEPGVSRRERGGTRAECPGGKV